MLCAFFTLLFFYLLGSFESSATKYIRSAREEAQNAAKKLPNMFNNDKDDPTLSPMYAVLTTPVYALVFSNISFCGSTAVNITTTTNGACISVPVGLYSVRGLKINCSESTHGSAYSVITYTDPSCNVGIFQIPGIGDCGCLSIFDTFGGVVGYVNVNCAGTDQVCPRVVPPSVAILAAIIMGVFVVSFICVFGTVYFCVHGYLYYTSKHGSVAPIPAAVATIGDLPPIAAVEMVEIPSHYGHYEDGLQPMRQPEVVVVQPQSRSRRHHHHHHQHRNRGDPATTSAERDPNRQRDPYRQRDPSRQRDPNRERDPNRPHRERKPPIAVL
jgi:hypothetical protein